MSHGVVARTPPVRGVALLLGLLVALRAGAGRAEEPPVAPASTAGPAVTASPAASIYGPRRVAQRGDRGLLHLRDGQIVEGTLVTSSDDGDAVDLADGKRRVFPGHSVIEVEPISELEPWAGLREGEVRAVLHDGGAVTGRLVGREAGALVLEERGGAQRSFRADQVKALYGPAGPLPPLRSGTSPSRIRALWAQTAFILDPGEVILTSSEVLTAQASGGVFRWTMVSAATTVPVGYASDAGGNATLRATLGTEVLPRLHLAGGLEAWFSSQGSVISGFGAVTYGDEAQWGSLYLGPPPTSVQSLGSFGDRLLSVSGGWRFSPLLAAVVEAWAGTGAGSHGLLLAAAARLRVWHLDVDAGLLTASGARLIPVLSISGTLVSP
jgi:hypothetical protein